MHALRNHIEKVVGLTDEQFSLILSVGKPRTLKKNQLLLREGELCSSDFFVLTGSLRQYYLDREGREHIVQFAFSDWWISDWDSLLYRKPSHYFIEAGELSTVIQFDYDDLQKLFLEIPVLERYFRIILQHAYAAHQRRILWLQKDAKDRYREFISAYGYFEQRLPQAQIASYLGITRESLSRLKRMLRNDDHTT